MGYLGHHLMLRLEDDRVIAPGDSDRRILARAVLERDRRFGLLAFGAADTHLHALATCDRRDAGHLARRIALALQRKLSPGVPFAPTRVKPVTDQHHLANTFLYVLRQRSHHELASDPWREASNLPDLLGLRVTGLWTANGVRQHLPRVTRQQLTALFGADLDAPIHSWDRLVEAALAAACLDSLEGRSGNVVAARTAAVHAAGSCVAANRLAGLLGVGLRSVTRMRRRPAEPPLVQAILGQLRLRNQPLPSRPSSDRATEPRWDHDRPPSA